MIYLYIRNKYDRVTHASARIVPRTAAPLARQSDRFPISRVPFSIITLTRSGSIPFPSKTLTYTPSSHIGFLSRLLKQKIPNILHRCWINYNGTCLVNTPPPSLTADCLLVMFKRGITTLTMGGGGNRRKKRRKETCRIKKGKMNLAYRPCVRLLYSRPTPSLYLTRSPRRRHA